MKAKPVPMVVMINIILWSLIVFFVTLGALGGLLYLIELLKDRL